jgi:hypothetical protein
MDSNRRGGNPWWTARQGVGLAAAAAMVLLAAGCARHEDEQVSGGASADQAMVVAQSGTPVRATQGAIPASAAAGEGIAAVSADSLPPDVAASVVDTLVYPGGSVEITAAGSPDVVSVTLSDGAGGKHPFAYDANSDTWKVFYRVPMKASTDRVALSVMARNATQRWRRVWLFLTVQRETRGGQADSSATP